MTLRSSGPHRGQVASPAGAEPLGRSIAAPSGPHSSRQSTDEVVRPLLRVVKGEPSAEELAALTVVVAALSQRRPRRRPAPIGAWASRADAVRPLLHPGPGGWRAAGRFS